MNQHHLPQNKEQTSQYKCDICRDTTFVLVETEEGQPLMKRCKCFEVNKAKKLWDEAGIDMEQAKQTFTSFKAWNTSSTDAKGKAIEYYQNFKSIRTERSNSIAFVGQVGSGKTHLSIALAVNFLKKDISVVYMSYRDVITKLKQNMIDEEYYQKELKKYKYADVLLIDDLFKGKVTESDINIMFEIVNHRYMNNSPIIVSSEFSVDKLLDVDEGVSSRIIQMCKNYTIEIVGKDSNYRLK